MRNFSGVLASALLGLSGTHDQLTAADISRTISASATTVAVTTPAATVVPADLSAPRRRLDAELESLQRREKSLQQAIATQEAERNGLMANANQSWEKTRLPINAQQLIENRQALASVQSDLKSVSLQIAALSPARANADAPTFFASRSTIVSKRADERAHAAAVTAESFHVRVQRVSLQELTGKYLGETEKNLSVSLAAAEKAGALLFLDEADALFSKRTTVKDSHDRYANVDASALLQRLEQSPVRVVLGLVSDAATDPAILQRWSRIVPVSPTPVR